MDKKPSNTYSGVSKSLLKSLNRSYYAEPVKDYNRIDEIMSEFIQGELNTIENILNSKEILNFKDQTNQTLIHAILKNESPNINEENKLSVICDLIDKKNVSVHTMNNFNQNPLHLACQNGYNLIITNLINRGCDQTLVDNYGNTPIHYLVDKFIRECGNNDFYSQSNKQINLSNLTDLKKINSILKNQSILVLSELLNSDNDYYNDVIGESGAKIINALKKFISNKVQSSLPKIYELIDDRIKKVNEIFGKLDETTETKIEKAKERIFNINNDIFEIYGIDMEFSNIIWNNFLSEQNLTIKNKKLDLKKKIFKDIEIIKESFVRIYNNIYDSIIQNIYLDLSKFMTGCIYFRNAITYSYFKDTYFYFNNKNGEIKEIKNNARNLIKFNNPFDDDFKKIIKEYQTNIINKLFIKKFKIFTNGVGNVNNLDEINITNCKFINNNYKFNFCLDNENIICNNEINFIVIKDRLNKYFFIPNELKKDKINDLITNLNKMNQELNNEYDENYINNNQFIYDRYFKYSPIRIIVDIIMKYINIIYLELDNFQFKNDLDFIKKLEKFYLFDIKYFSEIIIKIINNIVILEKYLNDIDIKEIEELQENLNKYYTDMKDNTKFSNEDFNYIIGKFDFFIKQISLKAGFIDKLEKIDSEIFDTLYDKNKEVLDKISQLTKNINEYFSLDQLEKYNEFLSTNIKDNTTDKKSLDNTIFNNYTFSINCPQKYKEYKNKYFKIKEDFNLYTEGQKKYSKSTLPIKDFIINENYKKDFIENNWKYVNTYDFNIFYLDEANFELDFNNLYIKNYLANIYDLELENKKYSIDNYKINGENKFSRGYDILRQDTSGNLSLNGIEGKDEDKRLFNMSLINNNPNYAKSNSTDNSIEENPEKTVSWKIIKDYEFDDIDKFDTYIITNNLNQLVNMLTYMIYEKIKPDDISEVFFSKKDLDFTKKTDSTAKITKSIGISLENINLDSKSKISVEESLDVIQANSEQKRDYLLDNIKSFVKIILYEQINKEIFKIMDEIKIKKTSGKQQILSSTSIESFNRELSNIDNKYKSNFWSTKFTEYIRDLDSSSTLEFQEMINLSGVYPNSELSEAPTKIIGSKCLNKINTQDFMKINGLNYRVLDSNGNTILIRLIEQYNIYGIKKLLESKKVLSTYKNNNKETPLDYISGLMKNMQKEYEEDNFKERMERYSTILENTMNSSNQFEELELVGSKDLVSEIISNCVYLFNEIMWLKVYLYPNGWSIEDKNNIKELLGFKEEKLLINSFDEEDEKKYSEQIKSNFKSKIDLYIDIINKEILELENKSKELRKELGNANNFISDKDYDISGNIVEINKKIQDKKDLIKKIESQNKAIDFDKSNNIKDILNNENKLLDIKNLSIRWTDYQDLVNKLDDKYLKVIKILNAKCESNVSISNHLIRIFSENINNEKSNKLISNYFKLIYTPVFNEYWDLDRYDDSEYNLINNSILQILKINVVGIIKNELINTLSNYIVQLNKDKNKTSKLVQDIKKNEDLKKSIEKYLNQSLIIKLGISNPDKENPQIIVDTQKNNIFNELNKILRGQLDENLNQTYKEEVNKIIERDNFICENIGLNCYEEITKILYDGKKIAIYYEIYNELEKAINEIN